VSLCHGRYEDTMKFRHTIVRPVLSACFEHKLLTIADAADADSGEV
jgi:hypothetical protein